MASPVSIGSGQQFSTAPDFSNVASSIPLSFILSQLASSGIGTGAVPITPQQGEAGGNTSNIAGRPVSAGGGEVLSVAPGRGVSTEGLGSSPPGPDDTGLTSASQLLGTLFGTDAMTNAVNTFGPIAKDLAFTVMGELIPGLNIPVTALNLAELVTNPQHSLLASLLNPQTPFPTEMLPTPEQLLSTSGTVDTSAKDATDTSLGPLGGTSPGAATQGPGAELGTGGLSDSGGGGLSGGSSGDGTGLGAGGGFGGGGAM